MSVINDDGGGQGGVLADGYRDGADGVWLADGPQPAGSDDGRASAVAADGTLLSDGELLARLEL